MENAGFVAFIWVTNMISILLVYFHYEKKIN